MRTTASSNWLKPRLMAPWTGDTRPTSTTTAKAKVDRANERLTMKGFTRWLPSAKNTTYLEIEPHWQSFLGGKPQRPRRAKLVEAEITTCWTCSPTRPARGLHIGHPEGYTATDILARYKRARGFNVLHPIGWDAFGLPAERHAVKTGTHPAVQHAEQHRQLQAPDRRRSAFAYDWDREVDTTDPKYFRWTQWIFLQLFRNAASPTSMNVPCGGARSCAPCWPTRRSWTARPRSAGSRSNVGNLRQWVLPHHCLRRAACSPTLKDVDWPDSTKRMQEAWIGRSEGAGDSLQTREREALGDAEDFHHSPRHALSAAPTWCWRPEHPLGADRSPPTPSATAGRGLPQKDRRQERPRAQQISPRTRAGVFSWQRIAINPVNGAQRPDLGRRLRPHGLRHRRHHGRARARRARL